jgi:hypothetical protein
VADPVAVADARPAGIAGVPDVVIVDEPDVQVLWALALLHDMAVRDVRGVRDGETARRAAIVLLAYPEVPGTPQRCVWCSGLYYLPPPALDWLSAGREDALCWDCTIAEGALLRDTLAGEPGLPAAGRDTETATASAAADDTRDAGAASHDTGGHG